MIPETGGAVNVNPRYLAYCRANNLSPKAMQTYDAGRYPGGPNAGYLAWLPAKLAEYRGEVGLAPNATLSDADQADFTRWLEAK